MTVSSIRKRWPRFFTVPRGILEDCPLLSPAAKLIFVGLCQLVDNEYECFPAHRYIGEVCSMSEKTVRRGIRELREASLLTVEIRRDPDTGSRLSNLYTLEIPPGPGQIDQTPLVKMTGAPGQNRKGAPPQNGEEAPPQNDRGSRSSDPDPVNNNRGSVVVFRYREVTGLEDLTEEQAQAWIEEYGYGYLQDKLTLLQASLETINEPVKWLATALSKDWQPAKDLDQVRRQRRRQRDQENMQALREAEKEGKKHRIKPGQATDLIQQLRARPAKSDPAEGDVK